MELTVIDDSAGFDFSELKLIEAVRKALLEKEREKLLDESGLVGLSDDEKLKLSKVGLGKDEFSECRYLGHGAFEETLF